MKVSESIYIALRDRLMSGFYEPGTRLVEEALASELDASRTPVRAAIQKLIADGFLEQAPKRGAVVSMVGKSEIVDIYNLRIVLEGHAVCLASERINESSLNAMKETVNRMEDAIDNKKDGYQEDLKEANRDFHYLIYESSLNPMIRSFGSRLLEFPLVIGRYYIYTDEQVRNSIREHSQIINALETGDAQWAKSSIESHLMGALNSFKRKPA